MTGGGSAPRDPMCRKATTPTETATAANRRSAPPTLLPVVAQSRAGSGGRRAAEDNSCTVLQGARRGPDHECAKQQHQIEDGDSEKRSRPSRAGLFTKAPTAPPEEHGAERARQNGVARAL